MAQQERVARDLQAKRSRVRFSSEPGPAMGMAALAPGPGKVMLDYAEPTTSALAPVKPPQGETRITGFWRWKTVLVPPNAHVIHTRRGRSKPLHLGLGTSFRFNPATDTFLVVPGTMQTILINAQCICRELQGLVVQAYVQWIIDDFATAYHKLDFSDAEDPMRVVNVQLREQAEAAIKDKVATMAIDEVLSDKQPIIEELTARLRAVAEGDTTDPDAPGGLGLRIVTVQIKEAVVASRQVWEALQQPFRAERTRIARLAELEASAAVATHEVERRHTAALHAAELEQARLARETELAERKAAAETAAARRATEHRLALDELTRAAAERHLDAELRALEARQRIANAISDGALRAQLIAALPAIADKLPKPDELRTIAIGGAADAQPLASLITQVLGVLDGFRRGPELPRQA